MISIRSLLVLVPFALVACMAEAPPAESGDVAPADVAPTPEDAAESVPETGSEVAYGEELTEVPLVPLAELTANADDFDGQRLRVAGMITGVCAKRGCWIDIGAEEGPESVWFKVTDGVMVFPMSAQGKSVTAEGVLKVEHLDLEKTRARLADQAEESGEPFDPESVTKPMTVLRMSGLGAVVRDR